MAIKPSNEEGAQIIARCTVLIQGYLFFDIDKARLHKFHIQSTAVSAAKLGYKSTTSHDPPASNWRNIYLYSPNTSYGVYINT